ncbi:hypothetical protein [Leptospira meyeri]|uniref:hypothetical protein n=1 Tax=Leptospira meyeri TaxID=29508 RepID=UPI0002BD76C6|nr:hypothetical protein [Leptospira meyeri]EMJ86006.1 hypothetical protein LEP1GSC196_0028 [Leptospira meyeri serovar Semaranga str. Veldrot Semarang 173]
MNVVTFEKIEYLGKGFFWELYGTILSFFGVLISIFLMNQRSVYGYLSFFPLVTSAFYCYFSWKTRIRNCSILIDIEKLEFRIQMKQAHIIWNLKEVKSFSLDANHKASTSYFKVSFLNGESYFFRGHLEKSDIIKLFETFQIVSNSENLQIFEKLGSNRLAAIIFLGFTFVILTLYPIYLILLAFFR